MKQALLILLLLLGLSACNHENTADQNAADTSTSVDSTALGTSSSQGSSPAIDTLQLMRSLGAEDAVETIRNYYDALNKREYEKAYGYWSTEGGSSNMVAKGLEMEYGETKSLSIDPGKPEPIKEVDGTLSITIPLKKITMVMQSGDTYNLKGTYTLYGTLIDSTPQWRIRMMDIVPAE